MSTVQAVWIKLVTKRHFTLIVLPIYILALALFSLQKTDIGGARYDATNFHIPLILYIADNWRLPEPSAYTPFSLPLWHFLAAGAYSIGGLLLIDLLQTSIAVLTLYLLFSVLNRFVSPTKAAIGCATFGVNSYFVSASVYPTTDGLSFFSFFLFIATVNKMVLRRVTNKDLWVINFSISLSVLNRQMFVYLFVIYLLVFVRRRGLRRVIVDLLPSGFLVALGFYAFYVDYCEILKSSECTTVGTFNSLPVVINLPVAALLFTIFISPVFFGIKTYVLGQFPLILTLGLASMLFFLIYGSEAILKSNVQIGGGFFKFRELLPGRSEVFDIFAVSAFLFIVTIVYRKLPNIRWVIQSALVVWFSTLLGPVAFQRYFEPHLLLLGLMITFSMEKSLFPDRRLLFNSLIIALFFFQFIELLLSIFVNV